MKIEWQAGYYDIIDISIDKLQELFDSLIKYKFKRMPKFYWIQFDASENNFQILHSGDSYYISVIDYDYKINKRINTLYYFNTNGTKCYLNSSEFRSLNGKDAYNYIAREFNDGHKLTIPKTFTLSDPLTIVDIMLIKCGLIDSTFNINTFELINLNKL